MDGATPAGVVKGGTGWLGADSTQHWFASAWFLECWWFATGDDWCPGHGPPSQHSIRASGPGIHLAQSAILPDSNARLANIDAAARSNDTNLRMRPCCADVNLRLAPPATESL